MSSALFIVLDQPEIDAFVNGKAIAKNSERLATVAKSLGIKSPDEYVSFSSEDMACFAEEFGIEEDQPEVEEQWFTPDEGLSWISSLREYLQATPDVVKDSEFVLSDLAEYERVLIAAKEVSAKWHLAVDC